MIKTCHKCKRIVNQKSVNAQGYLFHPECFTCTECKKKIKDSFNFQDKNFYHAECFQKKFRMFCAKCHKALSGEYVTLKGLKYHDSCYKTFIQLKCSICSKPIEDTYNYDADGKYHPECFKAEKALKCNVCNLIIEGEYLVDNWGNNSHKKHGDSDAAFCDSCSRFISEPTSKGFTKYNDGRKICGICQETEIIEVHQTVPSKLKVIEQLNAVGFKYIPSLIKVTLTDKITINKMLGTSMTNNTHGCTQTVVKSANGKLISKEHSIAMLYGLPKLHFEGILAHELLHVWLNEKNLDMPDHETEGFCNLGADLIYRNDRSKFAYVLLKQLDADTDKVYGDGYRLMSKRLEKSGWDGLIKEVSNYKPQLIKKVIQ
jgi:hypothetical protein